MTARLDGPNVVARTLWPEHRGPNIRGPNANRPTRPHSSNTGAPPFALRPITPHCRPTARNADNPAAASAKAGALANMLLASRTVSLTRRTQ